MKPATAGYSGKALADKLGIKLGHVVAVIDDPASHAEQRAEEARQDSDGNQTHLSEATRSRSHHPPRTKGERQTAAPAKPARPL